MSENFSEHILIAALAVTNLGAGFAFVIPTAKLLCTVAGIQKSIYRYVVMLLGLYFIECVAFAFGMCTQVFTFGLAIVWGIVFGRWLRGKAEPQKVLRTAAYLALYGCAPTISFAACLVIMWAATGNGLLNAEQAANFGIPQFVPYPFNTVGGFCFGLAAGTIIIKTLITTGLVKWFIDRKAFVAAATEGG